MKLKRRWVAASILVAAVASLGLWSVLTPAQAIVEARVNLTAPYGNGFLAQVATTHAFCKAECDFFEVWSKCSLSPNQIVDIKVPVTGIFYGSQPTSFEASLYKPSAVGYDQWDGCQ